MSRVQLALNVSDLNQAIGFYSKLFATEPAKVRPGYANFAIADPPLKLVLLETADGAAGGTLNHLGVEVATAAEVDAATRRLSDEGLTPAAEEGTCCYAVQQKAWVHDPDGAPWEVYTVLADAPVEVTTPAAAEGVCCAPSPAPSGDAAAAIATAVAAEGACCS